MADRGKRSLPASRAEAASRSGPAAVRTALRHCTDRTTGSRNHLALHGNVAGHARGSPVRYPATIGPDRPAMGISELARKLDLTRSTTHRYVATLATLGYLQ